MADDRNTKELTQLESDALRLLVAGDHPALHALRQQVTDVKVASREKSPLGWFTRFQLNETASPLPGNPSFALSDVSSTYALPDADFLGTCFVLFVADGLVELLECAAIGSTYPASSEDEICRSLAYDGESTRDMSKVIPKLEGKGIQPDNGTM